MRWLSLRGSVSVCRTGVTWARMSEQNVGGRRETAPAPHLATQDYSGGTHSCISFAGVEMPRIAVPPALRRAWLGHPDTYPVMIVLGLGLTWFSVSTARYIYRSATRTQGLDDYRRLLAPGVVNARDEALRDHGAASGLDNAARWEHDAHAATTAAEGAARLMQ